VLSILRREKLFSEKLAHDKLVSELVYCSLSSGIKPRFAALDAHTDQTQIKKIKSIKKWQI
jgi:hypothetical protein